MKIGELLRGYRMHKEMGTREMAEQLGISSATLNRIENGEAIDGKTMIKLIAWLFG